MKPTSRNHITLRNWRSTLALAALAGILLLLAYVTPATRQWINDVDVLAMAVRYQVRGYEPVWPKLRVVGITENTLQAFAGSHLGYPFPRRIHAAAIRRLADAGARVVVLDILFSPQGAGQQAEALALRDAIAYAREQGCAVVLAAGVEDISYTTGAASQSLLLPDPLLMQARPSIGLSNTQPKLSYKIADIYGIPAPGTERGPSIYRSQAAMAYALAVQAGCIAQQQPLPQQGFFRVNYNGPPEALDGLLYSYELLFPGLFDGQPEAALSDADAQRLQQIFAGTVVFIGSRAKADNDYFNTPYGLMYGVDTNAQACDTLLQQREVSSIPPLGVVGLVAALALIACGVSLVRPLGHAVGWAVGLSAALGCANLLLFLFWRIELSATMSFAGFAAPFLTCALYGGLMEEVAKQRMRSTFSRYVSDQIVTQIIDDPSLADLGGSEKTVAVMFNDIRSYSTLTEQLTPQQIVTMLNCYLGVVTDIIRKHNGFVDKYLGDGLMACFGGPVPSGDPAGDAIRAALEMIRALYAQVTPELEARGLPTFKVGIGIHLGKVVMGNIGSQRRMDYTVIGDAVNVASRVEGQTKEFKCAIIATREVVETAHAEYGSEWLGERQVKGRQQSVVMHKIFDVTQPDIFEL